MNITFDVQVVYLRDAEKKVRGVGEVIGGFSDESGDGAKGVETVGDIYHALLLI